MLLPTLVSALLTAAPCAAAEGVAEAHQQAICELANREGALQEPQPVDLNAIFARPEFKQARERNTGALQVWLNRAKAWLLEIFGSSAAATFSDVTRLVVLFIGAAVALLFVVAFMRARKKPTVIQGQTTETQSLELDDPAAHLKRAVQLLHDRPREATREGLLALLSTLERRKLARPDRVKTNRELIAELPAKGTPEAIVRDVTSSLNWYDRAYYSLEPIEVPAAQTFIEGVQALQKRIEGGA